MEDLGSLGDFLRSMRESLGLTQEQLAGRTRSFRRPVSRTTVSALEQGKHFPTAATVVAICRVLHIEPMEVIDRLEAAVAPEGAGGPVDTHALESRLHECLANEELHESLEILATLCHTARHDGRRLVDWTILRSRALEGLGALVAAKAAAERALNLSEEHPDRQAEAYLLLAGLHVKLGNLPLAVDAAKRAVERSMSGSAALQARAWVQQGRALKLAGRHEDARRAFVAGREQAREADDPVLFLECEGSAGLCLLELGRAREAHMRVLACVERARRHDMPVREARWLVELGRIALADERIADAQRHADAALRMSRRCEEWPIVFGATMLRHRIALRLDPSDPDQRRVAYLRKVLRWAGERAGDREVAELRRELST